jgi:hypothetical protein
VLSISRPLLGIGTHSNTNADVQQKMEKVRHLVNTHTKAYVAGVLRVAVSTLKEWLVRDTHLAPTPLMSDTLSRWEEEEEEEEEEEQEEEEEEEEEGDDDDDDNDGDDEYAADPARGRGRKPREKNKHTSLVRRINPCPMCANPQSKKKHNRTDPHCKLFDDAGNKEQQQQQQHQQQHQKQPRQVLSFWLDLSFQH